MHVTEINRIIKALGDPKTESDYYITAVNGEWYINHGSDDGLTLLSDWLKKIPLHDRSGKDLVELIKSKD